MPASSDIPSPPAEAVVIMTYCSSGTATKMMLWRYIDTCGPCDYSWVYLPESFSNGSLVETVFGNKQM